MNPNRRFKLAKEVIHKNWQAGDVIHMRMGDDNVAHAPPLGFSKRDSDAAAIDRYTIVDQKAGQSLLKSGTPFGVE